MAKRTLGGEAWRRQSEELRRSGLARVRGRVDGVVDSEAGTAVGRPGVPSGKMFCSPGVDMWQAEVPGSLCKASGCFSGTKSKAPSSRENSASLTSRAKWQEVPTPACCPREPEKCPNASALGSSADSSQPRVAAEWAPEIWALLHLSLANLVLSWFWGPGDPMDEDPGIGDLSEEAARGGPRGVTVFPTPTLAGYGATGSQPRIWRAGAGILASKRAPVLHLPQPWHATPVSGPRFLPLLNGQNRPAGVRVCIRRDRDAKVPLRWSQDQLHGAQGPVKMKMWGPLVKND